MQALKDAMLAHSSSLGIGAVRVADRSPRRATTIGRGSPRPTATPASAFSGCAGPDLAEFLAGRITREEALKRIEVRVLRQLRILIAPFDSASGGLTAGLCEGRLGGRERGLRD